LRLAERFAAVPDAGRPAPAAAGRIGDGAHACSCNSKPAATKEPDFARMTQAEKLAWN
jgi:hypothetical protein